MNLVFHFYKFVEKLNANEDWRSQCDFGCRNEHLQNHNEFIFSLKSQFAICFICFQFIFFFCESKFYKHLFCKTAVIWFLFLFVKICFWKSIFSITCPAHVIESFKVVDLMVLWRNMRQLLRLSIPLCTITGRWKPLWSLIVWNEGRGTHNMFRTKAKEYIYNCAEAWICWGWCSRAYQASIQ